MELEEKVEDYTVDHAERRGIGLEVETRDEVVLDYEEEDKEITVLEGLTRVDEVEYDFEIRFAEEESFELLTRAVDSALDELSQEILSEHTWDVEEEEEDVEEEDDGRELADDQIELPF